MFLSIVIPVYNVEKYIDECIESILKQSFTDYEVILVDDGSTDKSSFICDEYAEKYSFINVIHKPNGGQADARNVGLNEAKGEYILFIDSDDYISDNYFFEDVYNASNGNDIICFKFQKYFENTKRMSACTFSIPDLDNKNKLLAIRKLSANDALYCAAWTKAIRRELLVNNNILFEVGCKCEDMKWYFEVLINAKEIIGIDKAYIVYRQRDGSVTKSNALKTISDNIKAIEDIKEEIKSDIVNDISNALYYPLSKLYCNLLISYAGANEKNKKQYRSRIKKMTDLLDYHENNRAKVFYIINRLFGFNLLIFSLKVLCKLK